LLSLVDNKFIIGRDEFLPFSAEVHYFRVPKRYWSICFDRIKKAGFRIISSFVPWNLHEERPGEFDFQGIDNPFKDLIVFLELAREFGFKIILKPGPWIDSEWPEGGLPKYIFLNESLIARDNLGGLLLAKTGSGVKTSYQPSYLHPKYLSHVKRYMTGLVEAIQNYIFPKGPIFLIQLDNEIDFGGNSRMFEADYNSYVVSKLYPSFLEEKYESVKKLPACYGKVRKFSTITPPVELVLKSTGHLILYFDWLEFKGKMLEEYISSLKNRWESLGVGCMFSVIMPFAQGYSIPVPWKRIRGDKTILGTAINYSDDFNQISRRLGFSKNLTGYSWSPQVAIGLPQSDEEAPQPVEFRRQRFLLISSLAAGLKGLNYYMFVGRDNWLGSALGEDGTVNQNYEMIKKLNLTADIINLSSAKPGSRIAIGLYKPYQWYDKVTTAGEFAYINDLTNQTFKQLPADLSSLNFDYEIYDLDTEDNFNGIKIMFVPSADYMAEDVQEKLANLVSKGMIVVFVGLMPRLNMLFKPTKALSKGLGIQTKASYNPAHINTNAYEFKSLVFGYLSNKGTAKTIARAGARVVGAYKKMGKGRYYFFTYDISSRGEPGKLGFLKGILQENKIKTPVSCSDPDVNVVVHTNNKGAIVYLINTDMNQPEDDALKKVVVAIDLSQVGFRQAKVSMINIFDEEKIQTTSQGLREGLIFELGPLDARIYWIPKK
jgi:beta-galactosidase